MTDFWNWMLEWGFPMLAMLIVFRLDDWRKERRKKRQDAESQRSYLEATRPGNRN